MPLKHSPKFSYFPTHFSQLEPHPKSSSTSSPSMVPLHSLSSPHSLSLSSTTTLFFFKPPPLPTPTSSSSHFPRLLSPHRFTISSLQNDAFDSSSTPSQPRTLFPGGFKRAEIKVPSIILRVTPEEVLSNGPALDFIDAAVADRVGIVVVSGGEGSGGKLYEASCLLKSVIRDRAYLLVAERVDIAAAVNASGVLLSDQGLPPIVARNTMMGSKAEAVFLPVVGKLVQTVDAAIFASDSEGADFLIYSSLEEEHIDISRKSITQNIKIPVFVESSLIKNDGFLSEVSKKILSPLCGVVTTLEELMSNGDHLGKLVYETAANDSSNKEISRFSTLNVLDTTSGLAGESGFASYVELEDNEALFIKKERRLLVAAANVIEKAAPLMEEISLLNDAISQLDEPFLLVIVGEFNSGKSTFINAFLGGKFLKDGVVPTTNEITFLRYAEFDTMEQQSCERHPDGQYICYLPSQILKKMIIVDTPGTNVILQRQQSLTEEFIPRADLLLFVLSADRPLTESEVAFLRYTQQWKKKVVFLLNKADIYRNPRELDEAISFVRQNLQKLLNVEDIKLFPISARSALEAKLAGTDAGLDQLDLSEFQTHWRTHSFIEFENFLYGFLDRSTTAGLERMKIKLETPIAITERLLFSCQTLVTQDYRCAKRDLMSVKDLMGSVENYALRMERESISWRRQISSLVENTKLRVVKLVESTLQLSNLDIAFSLISKGDKSSLIPATQSVHDDIVSPALSDAQKLLEDYSAWLKENYAQEAASYKVTFEKRWPSDVSSLNQVEYSTKFLLNEVDGHSIKSVKKFSGTAASILFDQEIRQVFLGAFGGLGAAGLSASLLTSVLPTTLEDLLALGLCSAGGLLAISSFPARKQMMVNKVKTIGDMVGQEIEEAMQKDLSTTITNMENFVAEIGKPYEQAAQQKLDRLLDTQEQLTDIEKKLKTLQVELQNFHLS